MKAFKNDIDALVYIVTYHAEPKTSPMLTVVGSDTVYTYEYAGINIPWNNEESNVVPLFNTLIPNIIKENPCESLDNMVSWEL